MSFAILLFDKRISKLNKKRKTEVSLRKKIFVFLATVLIGLVVWQHDLLAYGWMQGKGQLKIVWNAVPVEEVLADDKLPDSFFSRK